jgi:Fe-S-cluster containining protein
VEFDCLTCGACCRGDDGWVHLDAADDARVDASPALASLVVLMDIGHGHMKRTLKMIGGACAALGPTANGVACSIYADRPSVCRELLQGSTQCLAARRLHGMTRD